MVHLKRGIIVPTYSEHFNKNVYFLKSVQKNVSDIKDFEILFVTSNEVETSKLESLLKTHNLFSLASISSLPTILDNYNVPRSESENLLDLCARYGSRQKKFSYQAIKKIYGVKYSNFDEALVLDSECLVVKPTSFKEIFDNYIDNPIVFMTEQCKSDYESPGGDRFNEQALRMVDKNLQNKDLIKKWLWEYQGWFFQKNIVNSFFSFVEDHQACTVYEYMRDNRNIWEAVAYWWFIYLRKEDYPKYKFYDGVHEIKKVFNNEGKRDNYLSKYETRQHGIVEFLPFALTKNNFNEIKSFYDKFKLNFIRIEPYNAYGDMDIQIKLVNSCESIKLVVCSETASNHWSF